MRKNLLFVMMAAVAVVSCNKQSAQMDEQPVSADAEETTSGMKIAYVEVDSLMTQFEFAREKSKEIEKKSLNARNTLNQKGTQLQNAANNFQQKLQNNGFTSREQAESVQQSLQRQQNDLAALQARFESELANETQQFNIALRDSLNHFLALYNKDKKYDMILAKSGDNILLANAKYDITQDVINGLNKRYKKDAAKKEEKKEEKK